MTKAQSKLLHYLKSQKNNDSEGWVFFQEIPFSWQRRVMDALVNSGLVEESRGEYRAT